MTSDLNKLNKEFEEMLAELGPQLDVPPPPAAVERTRSAMHHALNEAWLTGEPQPTPSSDAVEQTRRRMHEALNDARPGRRYRWAAIGLPLAAAAAIALAVGLNALMNYPADTPGDRNIQIVENDLPDEDLFVETAEEVFDDAAGFDELAGDLALLEETLQETQLSADLDAEGFGDIDWETETLIPDANQTSRIKPTMKETWG